MDRSSLSRLGRLAAVAMLVCGVLLLGTNSAAWANPALAPLGQTVPTVTPAQGPGPRLNLSQIRCSGQYVQVDFVVVQLPDDVSSYGTLSYVVDGQNRSAFFSKRTGDVAHYLDNIVTAGLVAAIWFGALIWTLAPDRLRLALGRALWVGVGLLVYLYLPLRAIAHPPVNWGYPRDWYGFWWVVSGQPYRGLAFGLPAERLNGRVAAWAALLTQQFGWLGLGFGFVGLLYGAPNLRRFVWLSAALAAVASIFAVT